MTPEFFIEGRAIGPGHPAYVIAEISANHNQRFEEAERLVRVAKDSGADAVKLQTYTPDTITIQSDSPLFRHGKGRQDALRPLWRGVHTLGLATEAQSTGR
jgi:sialic acid synthase SpsE